MAFVPTHNQVGFLKKPEGSAGFEQIVDFLKGTHIRYALEHNPTIYVSVIKQFWQTVTVITLDNGEQELKATIDTHEYTISESSVRNKLKLADENGITEFTNAEIFEGMANLGYPIDNTFTFWKKHFTPNWKFMVHHILHCISSKSGGWDQFGSKLATTLICLSTGRTYNFSKMIFEAMVANLLGIDNLEKELKEHKQTTAAVIVKLVTKGRNLGEEDVFETPKGKDSREADISPSGLQKKLDVGVSSSDRKFKSASEEIKSGFTNISSGEVRVSQRKGKEVLEEQPQPKRSKKQIREEEASLAKIARIQAQEAAQIERKGELQRLDALATKRLNDEFKMSEQQRKRATEVQQQAQYYTEGDWELIRARMEASIELRKSVFSTNIDAEEC
ncbi:hypothetical protein Tco_0610180 [Tanacetum coccineum]